ncbi:MAG: hypothetical protein ACC641_11290 [Acidiferrobacterales bacterium]
MRATSLAMLAALTIPNMARNVALIYKEMAFTVCNLRYNKGAMEYVNLDYELTSMEDDE